MNGRGLLILLMMGVLLPQAAYGKRSKRKGFNFGSTLRLVNTDQPGLVAGQDGDNLRNHSSTRTIRPSLGYAIADVFNLGVEFTLSNEESERTVRGSTAGTSIFSNRMSDLNGAAFISRFLFGRVMYFQAGVGYYERNTRILTEYITESGSGSYSGTREHMKVRSGGAGYHLGAGIEIPIAYGFFFTTDYSARIYDLKAFKSVGNVGEVDGHEESREVSFGVSHYYR